MKLHGESIGYSDGIVYCVPRNASILYEYKIREDICRILSVIPEEDYSTERLFNGLCIVDNMVVLVPYSARKIWIYNILNHEWTSVDVGMYVQEDNDSKFSGCIRHKSKVYMFGYGYNGIISLDMNTFELNVVYKDDSSKLWGQNVAIVDDEAYIAFSYEKKIARLNLKTGKVCISNLDASCTGFASTAYDGENILLLPSEGNKYYVLKGKEVKEHLLPAELTSSIYNGLVASKDYIYGYSFITGNGFLVNRKNEKVDIIKERTCSIKYYEDIGYLEAKEGEIRLLDNDFKLIHSVRLEIDKKEIDDCFGNIKLESRIYNEGSCLGLEQFIDKCGK